MWHYSVKCGKMTLMVFAGKLCVYAGKGFKKFPQTSVEKNICGLWAHCMPCNLLYDWFELNVPVRHLIWSSLWMGSIHVGKLFLEVERQTETTTVDLHVQGAPAIIITQALCLVFFSFFFLWAVQRDTTDPSGEKQREPCTVPFYPQGAGSTITAARMWSVWCCRKYKGEGRAPIRCWAGLGCGM